MHRERCPRTCHVFGKEPFNGTCENRLEWLNRRVRKGCKPGIMSNRSRMAVVLSQSILCNLCAEKMHAEAAQEFAIRTERSPYMAPLRSVSELRLRDREEMLTRFKGVTTLVPTIRALVTSSRPTHTAHYSVICLSNAANLVATDLVHLLSPPCISLLSRLLRLPSR